MPAGRLIVFEGIDGSGKSTQLRRLAASLERSGNATVVTHEPTDGTWGRRIREMARSGQRISASEELRWFTEDRREHVAEILEPARAAGKIVLCDRYYLSSVAYQGARGLDAVRILADSEAEFPHPDLAILVEVPPKIGLARVSARHGTAPEPVFEEASFQQRVADCFDALECTYLVRVNGVGSEDEVAQRIAALLESRVGLALS